MIMGRHSESKGVKKLRHFARSNGETQNPTDFYSQFAIFFFAR
jgi:hypothetical protein